VIRTNLPAEHSNAAATVRAYKSLSGVEHAFRSLKTVDLELRPVFHWTAPRVGAHVLLCMLAYYLQWHMRQSLAPMLFDEPDPAAREAQRTSPVAKAEPSPAAQRKAARKRTDPADGEPLPVHSFHTLLGDLATLTRNVVGLGRDRLTAILATPTRTRRRALDLPRRYAHCVDRPPPPIDNDINGLLPKAGKVWSSWWNNNNSDRMASLAQLCEVVLSPVRERTAKRLRHQATGPEMLDEALPGLFASCLLFQRVKEGLCSDQIGSAEALCKPIVDRREEFVRVFGPAAITP
jgi:hypothetical protein